MKRSSRSSSRALVFGCLLVLSSPFAALAADWDEITPEEFAQSAPLVDPDAGVEILFARIRATHSYQDYDLRGFVRSYVRMKVFNEAGVEQLKSGVYTYRDGERVDKIEARTVKPDGSVYELDRKDVFETTIKKTSWGKEKGKSFTFPNLAPGDIVEVQLITRSRDRWSLAFNMSFDYPAQKVTVEIRPAEIEWAGTRVIAFQYPAERLGEKSRGGYYFFELENQPISNDEEFSIPRMHTEPFVAMYYIVDDVPKPDKYWKKVAKDLAADAKKQFGASGAVKDKAKELIAGAHTPEEKLRRIYDFCASQITNRWYDFGKYSDSEDDELKSNDSAGATLKRGYGFPWEIRYLFGALADSAGFEVALVSVPDKRDIIFTQNYTLPFALEDRLVAVKLGSDWNYFNPGNPVLPFGIVNWWNAGTPSLMGDRKSADFSTTPASAAEANLTKRTGDFQIDEKGTLSGKVTLEYTGYKAVDLRMDLEYEDQESRIDIIKDEVTEQFALAKVENISFQNMFDRDKPLVVTYDLELPEYADVAGKRIFVQPSVFFKDKKALFQEEERKTDYVFPYAWSESDNIVIHPPEGYTLEQGESPQPLELEGILSYRPQLGVSKKDGRLIFSRDFSMLHTHLASRAQSVLKKFFGIVALQDGLAVTYAKGEE